MSGMIRDREAESDPGSIPLFFFCAPFEGGQERQPVDDLGGLDTTELVRVSASPSVVMVAETASHASKMRSGAIRAPLRRAQASRLWFFGRHALETVGGLQRACRAVEDADPLPGDPSGLRLDIRLDPGLRLGPSRCQLFGRKCLPEGHGDASRASGRLA